MESYKPTKEDFKKAEEMMTEKQKGANEQREKEWEKRNFEAALRDVCERYPGLSEKIKTSLETPQLGEHHNEGPKMDAHLSLMLKNLELMKDGEFHESLRGLGIEEIIKDFVVKQKEDDLGKSIVNPTLIDYTFLHDIAKPDSLTLKTGGDKKGIEITWEQWQKIREGGEPFQFEGKPIVSISYFHSSEGSNGQHGNKAAEMLKAKGVAPEIVIAISKHEVAYQFGKINAATFEEHFVKSGFTEDQQRFILVASFIDTIASLGPDGKPDLDNFVNLVKSRNNSLLIKRYIDRGIVFRENELTALKKQDKVLTEEDIEKIIPKEEKYNLSVLREKLDILVSGGQISVDEREQIISIVSLDPKELGKKFGPKMKVIKPLLDQSKE